MPQLPRRATTPVVFIVVLALSAFLWFVRGPWDGLLRSSLFQFLFWTTTATSTVLSLLGISLREVFRGPRERPQVLPDFFVSRSGDAVSVELFATNIGSAIAREISIDVVSSPPLLQVFAGPQQHTAELPHGGMNTLEWKKKELIPIAALTPRFRVHLRVQYSDRHGRRYEEEVAFSGPEILGKVLT